MRLSLSICLAVLCGLLLLAPAQQASANVFAHNIRITQPATDAPFDAKFTDGTGAGIRFVLSDHADSVVVNISLGMTPVRTLRGTNFLAGDTVLVWDGKNDGGVAVGTGDYTLMVTAFDKGYSKYTEESSAASPPSSRAASRRSGILNSRISDSSTQLTTEDTLRVSPAIPPTDASGGIARVWPSSTIPALS